MKTGTEKESRQHNRTPASDTSNKYRATGLVDNRATTTHQLQLKQDIDSSPVATLQRQKIEGSFAQSIQRVEEEELMQGKFDTVQRVEEDELLQGKFDAAQRMEEDELLQGKFDTVQRQGPEEEEMLQGKFDAAQRMEEEELMQGKFEAIQKKENNTGLPDNLKAGIENLSGMDMSAVSVHKNSSKPAQLNALAYAQGSDIHLGSGQEKHLPHEAWHVVQQAQGRVKPTMQMADAQINDDVGLETEADVMGEKALNLKKS